jgi:hypothetical protein
MHPRTQVVADIAGLVPGQPVTEMQIEALVELLVNDMMHYVHHVDSGKYTTLHEAVERINFLIRESYGLL